MKPPEFKCVKRSFSFPEIIDKMADQRTKEEDYISKSSYIQGLIVFDYYCKREHWLTSKLMAAPREVREKVFQEILENPGKESTWIDHMIERKVKEWVDSGKALKDGYTNRSEERPTNE